MNGFVKWFDPVKRYGFIKEEDGVEYFVHHNSIDEHDNLEEAEEVEFETFETEKGVEARDVKVVS